MRTTLDIDVKLLAEAMRVTGASSEAHAVRMGLEGLVEQAARRRLKALRGKFPRLEGVSRRRTPS